MALLKGVPTKIMDVFSSTSDNPVPAVDNLSNTGLFPCFYIAHLKHKGEKQTWKKSSIALKAIEDIFDKQYSACSIRYTLFRRLSNDFITLLILL